MSQVAPHLKRRSPPFTSIAPSQSELEDVQWSWDDIARLGADVRKIRHKTHRIRLLQSLRSLEPQLEVNLCELSTSTLLALREEVELINHEKAKDKNPNRRRTIKRCRFRGGSSPRVVGIWHQTAQSAREQLHWPKA
jgi:hypothetical protein